MDLSLLPDQGETLAPVFESTKKSINFDLIPDKKSALADVYARSLTQDPTHAAEILDYSRKLDEDPMFIEKNKAQAQQALPHSRAYLW